jgi:hypothetical protein
MGTTPARRAGIYMDTGNRGVNDPKRARDRSSSREPGSFTPRFLSHHNGTAVRGGRKRRPVGAELATRKLLPRRRIHAPPMLRYQSRVNCSEIESGGGGGG